MNYFYNDVNDWLSTGGDLDLAKDLTGQDYATTIAQLRAHGVTHVLDVRSEWEDKAEWVANGLDLANYCHAPIIDHYGHSPDESWYKAVEDFVLEFWLTAPEGGRLYVHCHMGINRGTSAAMLALLVTGAVLDPFDAFLAIREARPAAGLVYAEAVGARHIARIAEDFAGTYAPIAETSDTFTAIARYVASVNDYWTPDKIKAVNRGIAYYRSAEGGTLTVNA